MASLVTGLVSQRSKSDAPLGSTPSPPSRLAESATIRGRRTSGGVLLRMWDVAVTPSITGICVWGSGCDTQSENMLQEGRERQQLCVHERVYARALGVYPLPSLQAGREQTIRGWRTSGGVLLRMCEVAVTHPSQASVCVCGCAYGYTPKKDEN